MSAANREREQWLRHNGWNWGFVGEPTPKNVFKYHMNHLKLLRPTIRVER